MPVLVGDLLSVRKKHVSTIALDKVHDVIYAFHHCPACDAKSVSIHTIVGNAHGIMNDPRAIAKTLLDTPERLIPDAANSTCACPSHECLKLEQAVLCRTNPRKGNDFHLRVRYGDLEPDDVFAASLLFPDGRYVAIPTDKLIAMLTAVG